MRKITKSSLAITLIIVSSFSLAACETMYGAGRDIEKAGDSVQDAAQS